MAKRPSKEVTWGDWLTRAVAIAALAVSLFNFAHERQKTKVANARTASELNDKAWEILGGEPGSQEIAQGGAANRPVARNRALNLVKQGLLLVPDDPHLLGTMGVIMAEDGRVADAKKYYQLALNAGSTEATPYTGLGALLQDEGKTDDAIKLYRRGLTVVSEQPWNIYFNLGGAYVEKRQWREAAVAFRKAIEERRDFVEAYDELAFVLGKQGKQAEADRAKQKAAQFRTAMKVEKAALVSE